MEATSDSGAPTDSGDISSEASSMEDQKVCAICKVPVVSHIGKTGPGRCLGGAFTIAFRTLLETVSKLERELLEERAEARDREVRLRAKLEVFARSYEKNRTRLNLSPSRLREWINVSKSTKALSDSLLLNGSERRRTVMTSLNLRWIETWL